MAEENRWKPDEDEEEEELDETVGISSIPYSYLTLRSFTRQPRMP